MTILGGTKDAVIFAPDWDHFEDARSSVLHLDRDVWEDMDRPWAVTVTIRPGDLLND